jgi:endo-1,4-beta-xylanase
MLGVCACLCACTAGGPDARFPAQPAGTAFPSPSPTPFQPASPIPAPTLAPSPTPTATPSPYQTPAGGETLRSLADAIGFGVGAPFLQGELRDPSFESILRSEFNTVHVPTFMKKTQPEPDRFDWSIADAAIPSVLVGKLSVIGGPLVYNDATAPDWLGFDAEDCGGWDPETLEGFLNQYVQTVVARFGGRASVWEVVNEPLSSSANCWRKILGEGYIARAFRYAREADPDAVLLLNEAFGRGGVDPELAGQFLDLIRSLKDEDVPLDAIGIQMHLSAELLRQGYADEFRSFLAEIRELGLRVLITEMDVYQGPAGCFEDPFDVQRRVFGTIARICLEAPECTHLITWGISDRYTWLARIEGGTFEDPRPLLFDGAYERKPAYYELRDALREALLGGLR